MPDFGLDAVISGYSNPTSLQFVVTPSGETLLISSQQNGTITIWKITSTGTGAEKDYSAEQVYQTNIINTIVNHDDDGTVANGVNNRQVTGLLAKIDENGDIVVYVSSSDPRIGGGGESTVDEKNLDTNSGIISKLTFDTPEDSTAGGWDVEKVDLVRGLPRSEENHSVNGMEFTPDGKLLVMIGGFANAGAPSQNLGYTPEYFLSGTLLEVDIEAIEALPTLFDGSTAYKYDLPTLGIERGFRPGEDVAGQGFSKNPDNPFGGNDGYNQAYLEPGGPIEMFATGFRNGYDVQVVQLFPGDIGYSTEPGADNFRVYVWDNGANNGWGDAPKNLEGQYFASTTAGELTLYDPFDPTPGNPNNGDVDYNEFTIVPQADGEIFVEVGGVTGVFVESGGASVFIPANRPDNIPSNEDNDPVSPGAQDQLHFVERGGYYGSPNASLANPDAILYLKPELEGGLLDEDAIAAPEFTNAEGEVVLSLRDFIPGGDPVNGFEISPLEGFYLKPSTGGNSPDGALVLNNGSTNGIVIFEYIPGVHPEIMEEFDGDLFAVGFDEQILHVELSEDGRTAENRAFIEANNFFIQPQGTNPLDITVAPDGSLFVAGHGGNNLFAIVPGGEPLVDSDNDDNDDLTDNLDPFQLDPENGLGLNSQVAPGEIFEFTMENELPTPNGLEGFVGGLTGHQVNYDTEYFSQGSGVIAGGVLDLGIAGKLQIEFDAVGDGTAEGTANNVVYALQAGVNYQDISSKVLLESKITNVWNINNIEAGQSQGIYFGTGTQFDYAAFVFAVDDAGNPVVRITVELNDVVAFTEDISVPGLFDILNSPLTMRVVIDRDNLTAQAVWSYTSDAGPQSGMSDPVALNPGGGSNNLTEAVLGAGQGGFLAKGAPTDGEAGNVLFSDDFGGVPLGLAVGLTGRVPQVWEDGNPIFTPEFDNLLITASDATGNFGPDVRNEVVGEVTFGETLIVDVADLLANDRDFDGGTLAVTAVQATGAGTATLINGGTQVAYTPGSSNDSGFTYTVSDGTSTAEGSAIIAVAPPVGVGEVVYRLNAGSGTVAAIDGGPDWIGDTTAEGAVFKIGEPGTNFTNGLTDAEVEMDLSNLPNEGDIPWQLFTHERSDTPAAGNIGYSFDVDPGATYAVTIYYVENWQNIFTSPAQRIFDIEVNGTVPEEFNDIHPLQDAADALGVSLPSGALTDAEKQPFLGTAFARTVIVTAETAELVLDFIPGSQNPKVNAIEIRELNPGEAGPTVSISDLSAVEGSDMVFALDLSDTSDEEVTVTYEIVPGTAQPGVDYTSEGIAPDANGVITGTKTFAVGAVDSSISVTALGNEIVDGERSFTINIISVSGADASVSATSGSATGTITDDDVLVGGEVLFAINAGGTAPVDGALYGLPGVTFETDTAAANHPNLDLTGSTAGPGGAGNNTNNNGSDDTFVNPDGTLFTGDTTLFESERWSNQFGYDFDVPNGDYIVDLYFAETFQGVGNNTSGVGGRNFDVALEGETVLDDFDLFDEGNGVAGDGVGQPLVPIIRSFAVTVTDGQLNIDLNALVANGGVDNAKISALVVRAAGEPAPTPATISITAPADALEAGDTGVTTLDFAVDFDMAPSEAVTVSYSVLVNGVETVASADLDLGTTGGVISVDVANDDLDNDADSVVVTLLSTTAGSDVAVLGAATSATANVTEDDAPVGVDPLDIDGDGILNTDDPFALDGTNGDAKVLLAGGEFVQDFNTDATNPLSVETGFTGILVNPAFDPAGASETDAYGDRTTDGNGATSGGLLSVTSSNDDSFGPAGTAGANNIIKDNYQSAVDVTGVDEFEVVARAENPFFGVANPVGFQSFGITLGAGGVDDFVKLVFGGSNQGVRIEIAHQGSLTLGANAITLSSALSDLVPSTIAEIEFKLTVDTTAGANGQLIGEVTFFGADGGELGTITTPVRDIAPGSSLLAALNGENPLTGGDGGLAYGISITDWGGTGNNSFTAQFDSLAVRALDPAPQDIVLSINTGPSVQETGDLGETQVDFVVTASEPFTGTVDVEVDVAVNGEATGTETRTLSFVEGQAVTSVLVANDDLVNGIEFAELTIISVVTPGFALAGGTGIGSSGAVTEDEFNTPFSEAVDGDLSGDNLAPTDVRVALGDNLITAGQQGNPDPTPDDRDFFTITIEEGQVLEAITLDGLTIGDAAAFIAFAEGATFDTDIEALENDPGINPADVGVVGGYLYGTEDLGTDLLENMQGIGTGFPSPLPAGTYTFWLNQNGPASQATLNFQIAEVGSLAIADAPTLVEGGDEGVDQLAFAIATTPAKEGEVELTFDKTVDGVTTSETATVTLDASGQGTLLVDVAQDDADTGDTVVSVTLTGTTSTAVTLDAAAATATGTVTEDDVAGPPVGFAPGDDLDQDGTINSEDDDIDGDGTLNGLETFRYDATNAGTALAPGESVRLEFDTDGTPFENGLTGALVRPNELPSDGGPEEVNLNNANVSGDALNITVTAGDHFGNGNAQQNAFVSAYSAENGLSVETRFEIPDYDPAADGDQASGNFQSSGVVIGVDQNTLVKAVYGRLGSQFELAQDATNQNNGNGSGTTTPANTTTPEGAEEVSIRLEVYTDPDTGAAMATAFYTFYDAVGDVIGEPDQEIATIALVDQPGQGNNLKTLVESGAPLGAGVVQTSTSNQSPPSFDVSYQYLEVTALSVPGDDAPTLDEGIAAQATDEDALYDFTIPADAFADDGGVESLTLTATLADDSALPAWLTFDPATGNFSGTPENGDVGIVSVKVTATDASGQPVDALFDLTVNNTNDAPEISADGTELTTVAGVETVIDLAPLVTVTDVDLGDVASLVITPSDPAITVDGTTVTIPAGLAADSYTITVSASDAAGAQAVTPVVFALTVDPEPDTTAPTAVIAPIATVTPDAPIIVDVTFADETALDDASIDAGDLSLTGPGLAAPLAASSVSVVDGVATYTFDAPASGWEQGEFTAALAAGSVTDAAGNGVAAASATATVDAPLVISLEQPAITSYLEQDEGVVVFNVALSEVASEDVTVVFAVTGDVTGGNGPDADYFIAPPSEVVIEAGQVSAQIVLEIANDDLVELDEVLNLNLVSTSAGALDAGASSATLTIVSDDIVAPPSGDPITLEAEDFTGLDSSAYFAQASVAASGSELIRLNSQTPTEVTTDLPEGLTDGVYTIAVTYFDEADGESSASIALDGVEVGSWDFVNDGGGNGAQSQNLRTVTFENVTISEGQIFSLTGTRDAGEFVRIDKVEFTRTGDVADNLAPTGTDIPDLVEASDGVPLDIPFSFTDPEGEAVTVEATLSDGTALPDWLVLGPNGLSGTPPTEAGGTSLTITVTATDPQGNALTDTFALNIADVTGPAAIVDVTAPALPTDPILATVAFTDASGVAPITVDLNDLVLTGPDGDQVASEVAFDPETGIATFTFTPTAPGWATGDYTATLIEEAVDDVAGNPSQTAVPVTIAVDGVTILPGANLDEDFDGDLQLNSADADIDNDGIANADDRFAYDETNQGVSLSEVGQVEISFDGLVAGDSPFKAGFTGVNPAFSEAVVELDYATNNGAQVVETANGNRLQVESSPTDTNDGQAAFTFGASVDGDFTFTGKFDNPYFGGAETPANFEQYGLIIATDGGDFLKLVAGSPGADFELSGKTENVGFGGPDAKITTGAPKDGYASVELSVSAEVTETAVIFTGTYTTFDDTGNVLDTGQIGPKTLTSGELFDALQGTSGEVPAFGVTHTQVAGPNDPFIVSVESLTLTDGNVDAEGPTALVSVADIADGDSPIVVTVTFEDETGVDALTIDGDELTLTSNDAGDVFPAPTVTDNGDGSFTYSYAPPAGGWQGTAFTAALVAGTVADTAPAANLNAAGAPVSFGRDDVDPVDAILGELEGVDSDGSYGAGDTGSVLLTVMDGVNNVRASNFGANSFELINTGDKQVAAVLIDVRDALYGDSVFDVDGSGGDTSTKVFDVNAETGDGTGAFFEGADSYVLAGDQPIPNTSGGGLPASGGFRGLLIKFDGSEGGFSEGELVGFSGDMDPNSIAGLAKGGATGVDPGAVDGWDVGGISGAELIGSKFIVVFDDGTTAEGFLHSDGSLAGSVGEAVQGRDVKTTTVTVNGFDGEATGATYGGTEPVIIVTGEPGDVVRVVMSQGFNPVTNETGGVADIVADRLATQHPDFQANNALNVQTVDVIIGEDGTATVPSGAFDYNAQPGNVNNPDIGTTPIAVTAAVIVPATGGGIDVVAAGPTATPVYLTNPTGIPVEPNPPGPVTIFQAENGTVVFEAESADRSGTQGWEFETSAEGANENPDPSGDGYIIWEGGNSFGNPANNSTLSYTFETDEGGNYTLKGLFGRRNEPNTTEANDVFVRLVDSQGNPVNPVPVVQGGETVLHVKNGEAIEVANGDFDPDNPPGGSTLADAEKWMKFYIGGVGLNELDAGGVNGDNGGINVAWNLDPNETYTLQIAGRSNDFEIDKLALSNNGPGAATNAAANAPESPSIVTGPTEPVVDVEIADQTSVLGEAFSFTIPSNAFDDADGDVLVLTAPGLPAGFAFEDGVLTADAGLAAGTYGITVLATDDDNNSVAQTFSVTITDTPPPVGDFQATVLVNSDDIELGSSPNSPDLESDKIVQIRLTIEDGVANVTNVESALLSFVSERGQGGDSTLNFQVLDSLDPQPFGPTDDFVGGTSSVDLVNEAWDDNEFIPDIIDLAGLINALIASQGPLNGGDVITLQMTGSGADRFIVQGTPALTISGSGGSTGGTNTPPTIIAPIADDEITLDDELDIDLSGVFNDADGDALTLSVSGLPNGVTFSGSTISGSPTQAGTFTVTVTANDGEANAVDTFQITVLEDVSTEPFVASAIADQQVSEGDPVSFTIPTGTFDDADGDTLTLTAPGLPAGFSFANGVLTASGNLEPDDYSITIQATDDDGNSVSDTFTVTVAEGELDTAPVVATAIGDQTVTEGEGLTFAIPANAFSDADGDVLEITTSLPAGLGFNPANDTITVPAGQAPGTYDITVTATDDDNNSVSQTFSITVEEAPLDTAPEVGVEIADQTISETEGLFIPVPANAFTDADGDTLTITAPGLPDGFAFNGNAITASAGLAPGTYTVTLQATDDDNNSVAQDFTVTVTDVAEPTGLVTLLLIDPETNAVIRELKSGDVIGDDELPNGEYNIQAVYNGAGEESVLFLDEDGNTLRRENGAPYALFSDGGGDFNGEAPPPAGTALNLTIQIWSENSANGDLLAEETFNLSFADVGNGSSAQALATTFEAPTLFAADGLDGDGGDAFDGLGTFGASDNAASGPVLFRAAEPESLQLITAPGEPDEGPTSGSFIASAQLVMVDGDLAASTDGEGGTPVITDIPVETGDVDPRELFGRYDEGEQSEQLFGGVSDQNLRAQTEVPMPEGLEMDTFDFSNMPAATSGDSAFDAFIETRMAQETEDQAEAGTSWGDTIVDKDDGSDSEPVFELPTDEEGWSTFG